MGRSAEGDAKADCKTGTFVINTKAVQSRELSVTLRVQWCGESCRSMAGLAAGGWSLPQLLSSKLPLLPPQEWNLMVLKGSDTYPARCRERVTCSLAQQRCSPAPSLQCQQNNRWRCSVSSEQHSAVAHRFCPRVGTGSSFSCHPETGPEKGVAQCCNLNRRRQFR